MCGIFGIYNLNKKQKFDKIRFVKSLLKMNYRGPDCNNVEEFNDSVILGHLRLAIIDLNDESNQPFQIDDNYWIVFNGEIYNFIEIRNDLLELGIIFRTSSDTEVLLRSFQVWGHDCVNKFNGMWAFAIYNKVENSIFCSRDRFGVKPFNYTYFNDQFIFSSEIKSIVEYYPELKKPNYNAISNYCRASLGGQSDQTWFENIYRLEPAHNLYIKDGKAVKTRYWSYPDKVDNSISLEDAIVEYKKIFKDAIKLRLRSDVPIGFTLSSGIDSTSLLSVVNKDFNNNNITYTAQFDHKLFNPSNSNLYNSSVNLDESKIVNRLSSDLNLTSNILPVSFDNFTTELNDLIYIMESGHSSPAIIPLNQILQKAKNDVTVLIEGQGADELLGGYVSNIFPFYFLELVSSLKFTRAIKELKCFVKNYSLIAAVQLFIRNSDFKLIKKVYYKTSGINNFFIGKLKSYKPLKEYSIDSNLNFSSLVNEHLFKSHTGGLVNLLHYGDAVSMANSLESRLPFMDYRLVEFVFKLPSHFKYSNGQGKYIHRRAMEDYVPKYILDNKIKIGFETPLHDLFKDIGDSSISGILLSDKTLARNLFSEKFLRNALSSQNNGSVDNSRILFRILSVELWFRNFIDQ